MAVPPSDPTQIRQHSATQKVSGTSTNSSRHTQTGFPFPYAASRAELSRAIQYGNYRSTIEQLLATWKKKLGDDLRRTRRRSTARKMSNHPKGSSARNPEPEGAPTGYGSHTQGQGFISDISFEVANRETNGRSEIETQTPTLFPGACALRRSQSSSRRLCA